MGNGLQKSQGVNIIRPLGRMPGDAALADYPCKPYKY